ncbi:autotransporter outer membrane beta-barrel domain-containing protein [Fusobacterium varium]|uniref:autotransporter family protein n=1 Tax=Fusobacterium varium TaxID=856 RepID=UPI0032C0ABC9
MIEKIMKAVKRGNKRRGRNITIGAVIGFLLSCTAVMGEDKVQLDIAVNDGKIKFNGEEYNSETHKFLDNTFDGETYTNNEVIFKETSDMNDTSTGIKLALSDKTINIINNGIIAARGGGNDGYGINISSGTIGILTNNGLVLGYGSNMSYGIYNDYSGNITTLINNGLITASEASSPCGIKNNGTITTLINNKFIISSEYGIENDGTIGTLVTSGASNGISSTNSRIGSLLNNGVIVSDGTETGIYTAGKSTEMDNLNNLGVVYGEKNAISNTVNGANQGTIKSAKNYGILVNGSDTNEVLDGLDIVDSPTTDANKLVNYGLIIKNEGKNQGDISVGTAGTQDISIPFYDIEENIMGERKVKVENVTGKNDDKSNSFEGDKENHILNALTNTYKVGDKNDEAEVKGSIINAYGTAVVFEEANKQLTLSGTIVNGGIDGNATILGSGGEDTLIFQSGEINYTDKGVEKSATQNTIVNGNINMGGGADTLTIGDGTIINGILDGGDSSSKDTLNFGISSGAKSNSADSQGINIMHNISNFENININTNVTLFNRTFKADGTVEELKVAGVESIKIGKDGNLILRIDGTNNNSHALSNNGVLNGKIDSDGGKLLLALNGVSDGTTIDMGMKLGDGLYGVENNDIKYRDLFTLETTSLLHSVSKNEQDNTKVTVISKSTLPLSPDTPEDVNYEKLNKIYQSMRVVDGVKEFNVDSDEKLSTFLGYLNDIYAGNPYSYSSELSRKSVGMFRDIAVENQFKPELNKWLIMGGLTHVDGGTKDTYYGKGYYTYDIGSSDMDADTKITGAYILGEYGVSDTLTYGVVIGGNKLKSDLSNGSKVDGDALYMGAYAKKYIGNLKVTGGLGLQYGDYDADRFAAGKGITETRSYSDNYNDMTYDIYLNGRYSHNIGNNLFLEPYGTLSYTYIKQDSADEGNKVLAIETDSKSFDYTAAKMGLDLKKVIPHEKGKSTLSAGVSYTRLLTGADEENITGRFKGGSDFDILVAHKNEHSIGLNAKYALELESGILFDVKGNYSFERDSHNESGKNRTKGEWIVGAGLGYKF